MVEHVIPKNLEEALKYLNAKPYKVIAGGTDLMVQHRAWSALSPNFKTPLLFCFNLNALKYIKVQNDEIAIGSMTDLETLLDHPLTPEILRKVISVMASPAIRKVSTLSGNIINASPAADSLLALYALDAKVVCRSLHTQREVLVSEMVLGPRKTQLKAHEIITEIRIPKTSFTHTTFVKVGGRLADAISKVAFVGCAQIVNNQVKDLRIVLNAVSATLIRQKAIESQWLNKAPNVLQSQMDTILEAYEAYIQPIDDQRSNKYYRKQTALNLIKQFINTL